MESVKGNLSGLMKENRESTTGRRAVITAWVKAGGQENKPGQEGEEEVTSVVVHFEDAALDDAHVAVPHGLVSAVETQREHRVSHRLL